MKTMPRPQQYPRVNTTLSGPGRTGTTAVQAQAQVQDPITTPELRDHLERLRGVSTVASKILSLLGEQISSASAIIPVQRGHDSVNDFKAQAKVHRDGLKTAFDPLRDQLNELKAGFWPKNRERLEAVIRGYVQKKVKDRVKVEVEKQLERYVAYVKNQETDNKALKEASKVSQARLDNSLLTIGYPQEEITWVGDLPNGIGPTITFEALIDAEEAFIVALARSLGLSPARDGKINTLNTVMRHLGIMYKGLPSRTGILLMPTATIL